MPSCIEATYPAIGQIVLSQMSTTGSQMSTTGSVPSRSWIRLAIFPMLKDLEEARNWLYNGNLPESKSHVWFNVRQAHWKIVEERFGTFMKDDTCMQPNLYFANAVSDFDAKVAVIDKILLELLDGDETPLAIHDRRSSSSTKATVDRFSQGELSLNKNNDTNNTNNTNKSLDKLIEELEIVRTEMPADSISCKPFIVTCKEYNVDDSGGSDHQIVWTREALLDLIILLREMWFLENPPTLERAALPKPYSIDEFMNLRTLETTVEMTSDDIFALWNDIGYNLVKSSKCAEIQPYDPYDSCNQFTAIYEEVEGGMSEKLMVANNNRNQKYVADQSTAVTVSICRNLVTNSIRCGVVPLSIDKALQALTECVLVDTILFATEEEAAAAIMRFNTVNSCIVGDVFLNRVFGFHGFHCMESTATGTINAYSTTVKSFVTQMPTTLELIEFILAESQVIPTTTWSLSSEVLDVLAQYMVELKNAGIATIIQRNQLSTLLAEVVPKKRFMAGQMFRMLPLPFSRGIVDRIVTRYKGGLAVASNVQQLSDLSFLLPDSMRCDWPI